MQLDHETYYVHLDVVRGTYQCTMQSFMCSGPADIVLACRCQLAARQRKLICNALITPHNCFEKRLGAGMSCCPFCCLAGIGEIAALENLSSDTFVFTDNGKQWSVARYGTVSATRALPCRTPAVRNMRGPPIIIEYAPPI